MHKCAHAPPPTHPPLTTIPEIGPEGSSTVIWWEEQKTSGFGTTEELILPCVVLGGVVDADGITGAGVLGIVEYGHCRSRVLYCAIERSQNLRDREMVVGV